MKLTDITHVMFLLDGAALDSAVFDGKEGWAACFLGCGKVKFKEQVWTEWNGKLFS